MFLATRLWLPSPTSVTAVLQVPLASTVAVAMGVALPLSNSETMLPGCASATVPVTTGAWLVMTAGEVMTVTGVVVSRSKTGARRVAVLPAVSVETSRRVWTPSPVRVMLAVQWLVVSMVAVASRAPVPLSRMAMVVPRWASLMVPLMVWDGLLVSPPVVAGVMVGAMLSRL